MIDAPGAIACAHSTSSEASPTMSRFCVVTPFWSTTWKLGGAGMPKNWSKVVRSAPSVGSTPSSTMAIVWPEPSPATVVPPGPAKLIWLMP